MDRVRCSLWRSACSAARRSDTSRTVATKVSPPAAGVTARSTGTVLPSARAASASTWPEGAGTIPGMRSPTSRPIRSASRRPNSHSAAGLADCTLASRPKVTMASATVSITERTRCSLARSAPVIRSARSSAPRRASARDQTRPKMSRLPKTPPARTRRGSQDGWSWAPARVRASGTIRAARARTPGLVAGAGRGAGGTAESSARRRAASALSRSPTARRSSDTVRRSSIWAVACWPRSLSADRCSGVSDRGTWSMTQSVPRSWPSAVRSGAPA